MKFNKWYKFLCRIYFFSNAHKYKLNLPNLNIEVSQHRGTSMAADKLHKSKYETKGNMPERVNPNAISVVPKKSKNQRNHKLTKIIRYTLILRYIVILGIFKQ